MAVHIIQQLCIKRYDVSDEIKLSKAQLTEWVDSLISMNHHGILVQREIESGNYERAAHLAERARKRAWKILNEMFECGVEKPEGYCEPGTSGGA
jgi:hypothetical protein